ncbi:hypothetical protein J6590_010338 [Homalodisca vitripennis]|nr:hypothetical protein J6590_010338 [Homalodisca vitripennis]
MKVGWHHAISACTCQRGVSRWKDDVVEDVPDCSRKRTVIPHRGRRIFNCVEPPKDKRPFRPAKCVTLGRNQACGNLSAMYGSGGWIHCWLVSLQNCGVCGQLLDEPESKWDLAGKGKIRRPEKETFKFEGEIE